MTQTHWINLWINLQQRFYRLKTTFDQTTTKVRHIVYLMPRVVMSVFVFHFASSDHGVMIQIAIKSV